MSKSKSQYIIDPGREVDMEFDCGVLHTRANNTAGELRDTIREEAGIEHTQRSKRARYYTVEETKALLEYLAGESPESDDRIRLRRTVEAKTAMAPRPRIKPAEALAFNKLEQSYILAAVRDEWPESEA